MIYITPSSHTSHGHSKGTSGSGNWLKLADKTDKLNACMQLGPLAQLVRASC